MIRIEQNFFPAHIRVEPGRLDIVQTNLEHSENTAKTAQEILAPVCLERTGRLIGLLHDMGKWTQAFAERINRVTHGLPAAAVNHSYAVVRLLLTRYHHPARGFTMENLTAEILAVACGSHHGLFDISSPFGGDPDGFIHRMTKDIPYQEAEQNLFSRCITEAELDRLFAASVSEIECVFGLLKGYCSCTEELYFACGMLVRLLLSALIEGDRKDTAEFLLDMRYPTVSADWDQLLIQIKQKLDAFPEKEEIDRVRRVISDRVTENLCKQPAGIYRLSVPTGGGKTLTTLRASIAHAAKQKKARIVFLTPLLSVLEQNAAVWRSYIADDTLVLEHHSNIIREKGEPDELSKDELLTENWHSPIIISTLVQFLLTLFSGKTSAVRRMQALCNSVVVIDEVQSVPRNMLSLFDMAVNFLAKVCRCTVVLCSATQPTFEKLAYPLTQPVKELIELTPELLAPFRRTELLEKGNQDGLTAEEIAAYTEQLAEQYGSVLVICNKKSEAAILYKLLSDTDADRHHLSTAMCMQHRIETVDAVKQGLSAGRKVICISTQLVEAGVDFSFGSVIRIKAGLDHAIQAAGRCNRNGEKKGTSPAYLIGWKGESLTHLKEIQDEQKAIEELLFKFRKNSISFDDDLMSDKAIQEYYKVLYRDIARDTSDFVVKGLPTILDMLAVNGESADKNKPHSDQHILQQSFKTAGEKFHIFEDNTIDLLVPFGDGQTLINSLGSECAAHDLNYKKKLLQAAKLYTVSLYSYQVKTLQESGGLYSFCGDTLLALHPQYYNADLGVVTEWEQQDFLMI